MLDHIRLQRKQIAEAIGVSRIAFGSWVNNRYRPGGDNLIRLLAELRKYEPELQVDDLFPVEAVADRATA